MRQPARVSGEVRARPRNAGPRSVCSSQRQFRVFRLSYDVHSHDCPTTLRSNALPCTPCFS